MTKYTFKTIVAPEAVRAEFTALRDQLNSSDKELMQAFWNIGLDRLDDLKKEVEMLQASAAQVRSAMRAEKQEMKAAAKLKEKAPKKEKKADKVTKVAAKKAPKKKAVKVTKVVDDGDDDLCCVVVDGTK
jgi:(p)ppGpp synthase/HD superfamily hydrolase